MASESRSAPHLPGAGPYRRALALVLLAIGLALIATSDSLHMFLVEILSTADGIIRARPLAGAVLFIVLSAASAMLAFVSSAVIVPVGVMVWGKATSFLLLWLGWIGGGAAAYTLSRVLGRRVMTALAPTETAKRYEHFLTERASFGLVLLFQTALPSELPGYLLGLVRYPFLKYIAALAIAELPYALATVYLGESFLERSTPWLIGVGAAIAAFSFFTLRMLRRRAQE